MDIVMPIIIAAALAAFIVIQVGLKRIASRAVGLRAPDTAAIDGDLAPGARRVYVFHAPHCGPCRVMMPTVDRIRETHPNLIKVDVSRDTELARAFGVVATPSVAVVDGGTVRSIKLGAQRPDQLLQLLGEQA
ncbi:MAG: thioredoxin family protein [Betaproteobacteria bacterium]|jgi:thioredoxin 1|nr:thioredoxin family protein [Betaproteobacteria bacterium]